MVYGIKMTTGLSIQRLNSGYLNYLRRYPLLTKCITSGVLCGLSEQLASFISSIIIQRERKLHKDNKDEDKDNGNGESIIKLFLKSFNFRVPLMVIYGFLISTPISHTLYGKLNQLIKPPLTPIKKIVQILLSLLIISPILNLITISFFAVINLRFSEIKGDLKDKISKIFSAITNTINKNFINITKRSVITSPIIIAFAQNYLNPEIWVVFFSFCYFLLGTYNNTIMKLLNLRKLIKKNI
ncbi:hypothetical protein BVG19_g4692 [[Candida] boidinii]|nr:hypothetical protein BVG19_g4692 [[Candida] boidinii]OWB53340.1 hypothetical protein B5S27_g4934 [[Candida] boidinii]